MIQSEAISYLETRIMAKLAGKKVFKPNYLFVMAQTMRKQQEKFLRSHPYKSFPSTIVSKAESTQQEGGNLKIQSQIKRVWSNFLIMIRKVKSFLMKGMVKLSQKYKTKETNLYMEFRWNRKSKPIIAVNLQIKSLWNQDISMN